MPWKGMQLLIRTRSSCIPPRRMLLLLLLLSALAHAATPRNSSKNATSLTVTLTRTKTQSLSDSLTAPTIPLSSSVTRTASITSSRASFTPTGTPTVPGTETGPRATVTVSSSLTRTFPTQTVRETFTLTTVATVTKTPTFDGASWLCRNVALTATIQQIAPVLGPTQSSGATVSIVGDVLVSAPLVIIVNITSCHTFFSLLHPTFALVTNQSSLATSQLLIELLGGSAGLTSASTGFALWVHQDPGLISFFQNTERSGTLVIGPDPLLSVTSAHSASLQLNGSVYFTPPALEDITVGLVILPSPPSATTAARRAAQSIAAAVAAMSLLVESPQLASIAGRIDAIYVALGCPYSLSASQHVSTDANILGLPFGQEDSLIWVAGGTVYNTLLLVGIASGMLAVVVFVTMLSCGSSLEYVMSMLRFPGLLVAPVMFLTEGTAFSAFATLLATSTFQMTFLSTVALLLLICCILSVGFATRPAIFDALVLRVGIETAAHHVHPAVRWIFGSGMWIDRTARRTPFINSFGALFREYRPGRQWFLVVELSVSFVLGLVSASLPSNATTCVVVNASVAAVLWLHLVTVVGLHPYVTLSSFALTTVTSVFLLAGAITASIAPIVHSVQATTTAVDALLTIAASVALVKALVDVAAVVYRVAYSRELRDRSRAWMTDTLRRINTLRLKHKVSRRLERALASSSHDAATRQPLEELSSSSEDDNGRTDPSHHTAPFLDGGIAHLLPHYDDRAVAEIRSSVPPLSAVPANIESKNDDVFLPRTGLTAAELWEAL